MRKTLLETFDSIYILDLHGDAKKKEVCIDGSPDHNVFDIMQGVSINIFVKTSNKSKRKLGMVFHSDLQGKRNTKYDFLNKNSLESIKWKILETKEPNYFFIDKNYAGANEYKTGFKIDDIFLKYNNGIETINNFKNNIESKEILLSSLIQEFEISDIEYADFTNFHKNTLQPISKTIIDGLAVIKTELDKQKESLKKLKEDFESSVTNSVWKTDYNANTHDFTSKKLELEKDGINDIENFEKLTQEKSDLEKELANIIAKALIRAVDIVEKERLQKEHLDKSKELTLKRKEFVSGILQDDKVKINRGQ